MSVAFKPSIIRTVKFKEDRVRTKEDILYSEFCSIKERIRYQGYGEMQMFIVNNITSLLTSAVDKKPKALQTITDRDFLIAMDIININLTREYVNRFNRVYRAYVINPAKNVIYNQESADLLYKIALKLNKKMTNILMSIGLEEKDALWLMVNRYSSTDERRNIRRMVRVMQHMNPYFMTEQMVVDIFSKTFNDQFTNLFVAIMTDSFDSFDNENEKYVYSTVSNALLDILNTMDEEEIKDILMVYEDELRKSGVNGRFSLRSINSGDYGIICNIVDELELMGFDIR